jgi:hypothetical protein
LVSDARQSLADKFNVDDRLNEFHQAVRADDPGADGNIADEQDLVLSDHEWNGSFFTSAQISGQSWYYVSRNGNIIRGTITLARSFSDGYGVHLPRAISTSSAPSTTNEERPVSTEGTNEGDVDEFKHLMAQSFEQAEFLYLTAKQKGFRSVSIMLTSQSLSIAGGP